MGGRTFVGMLVGAAALLTVTSSAPGKLAINLARAGTARCWDPNSGPGSLPAFVNDGHWVTFWGSNQPTMNPPKDVGIEWASLRTFSCVVVKYFNRDYIPAPDGQDLQVWDDENWRSLDDVITGTDTSVWGHVFPAVTTTRLRLLVTKYRVQRPAVAELEVYAEPPVETFRRPPLIDGGFWSLLAPIAQAFPTDEALAAQVDRAHKIGLDTLIVYVFWPPEVGLVATYPSQVCPQAEAWRGRDPVAAMVARADKLGMKVYLGETGDAPGERGEPPSEEQERKNAARAEMLDRYANHPSVVGYYLSTEWIPSAFDSDPSEPRERSAAVARFIKQRRPNLKTVMPIGLYNIVVDGHWTRMTPDFLETFWGSWAEVEEIDAYMIIDGVGTGLSSLVHTDACQAWARQFCDRYGKELWVDVECADMPPYQPLPIDRLIPSVEVAARYADVIVVFDYIYYMDHGVAQPAARELHESYAQYRQHYLATHPARRRTPLHFRPDFEPGT